MRILLDTYTRTVADGWGTPTIGEAWAVDEGAAADFDVTGTAGTINVAAAGNRNRAGSPILAGPLDLTITVKSDKQAEIAKQVVYLMGRRVDANNCYAVRLSFDEIGMLRLGVSKIIAGVETTILADEDIPGIGHTAGIVYSLRARFVDSYPCTIEAKVWYAGDTEPDWQISTTDATASLQVVGGMGVGASLETGTTNAPVLFTFDDLDGDNLSNGIVVTNNPGDLIYQDTFTRSVTDDWGTPDLGSTYAVDEPDGAYANFDVTGTVGTISVTAAGTGGKQRVSQPAVPNGVVLVKVKTDKLAVGGTQVFYVGMRQTTGVGTSRYAAKLTFTTTQTVQLSLVKVLTGTETALTETLTIPGTHAAGQDFWVRFSVKSTGTITLLDAKAWQDGTTEPDWQASTADSTSALESTSRLSYQAELGTGASNAPVLFTVDNASLVPSASPRAIVTQTGSTEAQLDMRVRMLDSASQVGWVVVGRRYAAVPFAAPWLLSPTPGVDTATQTDSGWVGGNYNRTTVVTPPAVPAWSKRNDGSIPSVPAGVYRVFGRFAKTAETDDYTTRLQWSVGTDQVSHVNEDVSLLPLRANQVTWIDLGLVEVPVEGSLNLEIWMSYTGTPTGNVNFDYAKVVPAERWAELRLPAEAFQRWYGDEGIAVGGTVLANGVATMTATSDAVRFPHSTGVALEATVLHIFEFDVAVAIPPTGGSALQAKVRKAPTDTLLSVAKSTEGRETLRLAFRQTTGGLYFVEVEVNVAVPVTVHRVRHNILRYAKKGQEFRVNSATKTAALHDTNGQRLRPILVRGDWPTVLPGDNEFVTVLGSVDTGSEDLANRDAAALLDLRAAPTY